jgi:hypothetical protein
MRKCRLLPVAGALALLGLAALLLSHSQRDPISEANFHRIQKGMLKKDVEAILGKPAFECQPLALSAIKGKDVEARGWTWFGRRHAIGVHFDEMGVVWSKEFTPDFFDPPPFLERLRQLLRW